MKIVEGSFEILSYTPDPIRLIETVGRTCYQSHGRAGPETADKFVRMLISRGHRSMLEMASVVVRFREVSRGLTHEHVRHRLASYAQESTRYVRQDDLHFVLPPGMTEDTEVKVEDTYRHEGCSTYGGYWTVGEMINLMQDFYCALLKDGWKPEDARQFLPIGTACEFNVSANFREWRHIFSLRCDKHAHWEIRHLMKAVLKEFIRRWPAAFDDLLGMTVEERP